MAIGIFTIEEYQSDEKKLKGILFRTKKDIPATDDSQLRVKAEVEKILIVIQVVFKENNELFNYYYDQLFSLASAGVTSDNANPEAALMTIVSLKNELVEKEGGKIKNKYLKELGKKIFMLETVLIPITIVFKCLSPLLSTFTPFFFLLIGCFPGVWLSFGVRKTNIKFEELHILEEDRLEPSIRLIFTGLLAIFIGLIYDLGIISINVGKISVELFNNDVLCPVFLGLICGFFEKSLPSIIIKNTQNIFIK